MKLLQSPERLLSIILNHLYPNGNVAYLIRYATLRRYGKEPFEIAVDLPDGHWAFTHADEPKRFLVQDARACGAYVMYRNTTRHIAWCRNRDLAEKFAAMMEEE